MAFPKNINQLCTPSCIYFIISILGLAMLAIQNLGNKQLYSLGSFSCRVPSTIAVFLIKLVYILFWTWILNLMCKDGHINIAWFLVLLPFILMFVIMGSVMMYQKDGNQRRKRMTREGMEDDPENSTRPSGGMGGSISRGPAATGGGGSGGWGGGAPTDDYVGGPEGMNIMR